jgi:hypothetical protein
MKFFEGVENSYFPKGPQISNFLRGNCNCKISEGLRKEMGRFPKGISRYFQRS